LKWRFDSGQSATGRDLWILVSLVAEPINAGFDPHLLTVEIIGTGRQPHAASNFVDVVQDLVDQGTEPCTLLTLLRCLLMRYLLMDHRVPPTAMFTAALSHATW
jgi:hypothetical protein